MIHAYDELYLNNARRVLANMLDHAVNLYGMELRKAYDLFRISSVAERFEAGDCAVIAGRSGAELFAMALEECGLDYIEAPEPLHGGRSREFWAGWTLAYYQWDTGKGFNQIERDVPIEEIVEMYDVYHEMDIRHFCDELDRRTANRSAEETRLSFYRKRLGMSQRQLAEAAGIPVRTIQQYEQRQKDINRARSEYIFRLSKVLNCTQQDLLEMR